MFCICKFLCVDSIWAAAEIYYLNSCQSSVSSIYLVFEVFPDTWRSNKDILVHLGMLPCLLPWWPRNMQISISFQSRSDLVLDADHALDFLSNLVLQVCISFVAFQIKVAHLCFCLVRIQMPLLSSGWRRRGVEFKGGSLHDGFGGFDGFGGSGEHLALLLAMLVLQNTAQWGNRGGFDRFDGFGGNGGFGHDGYPLKLNPPIPSSWCSCVEILRWLGERGKHRNPHELVRKGLPWTLVEASLFGSN